MEQLNVFQIREWEAIPVADVLRSAMQKGGVEQAGKHKTGIWRVTAGLKPVDFYVYLKARFGEPNGSAMFWKDRNDSGNLIHWHYSLRCPSGRIEIYCFNFRIEIWHPFDDYESVQADFIEAIKADFAAHGQAMGSVRGNLQKWQVFLNPYMRLKNMIEQQLRELELLELDRIKEPNHQLSSLEDLEAFKDNFREAAEKFSRASCICLTVRMLAPVLAESFVNLVLFVLVHSEIRDDNRLYESIVRQNIDIRIKSLHLNCYGFEMAVPYDQWDACKKFHSLMMGRNNMLHGNVDPKSMTFDEVYFEDNTPLFMEFHDFGFFSYKAALHEATPEQAISDYQVVQDLAAHIMICMSEAVGNEFRALLLKRDLGWDANRQRIGILFPDHLVDIVPIFDEEKS